MFYVQFNLVSKVEDPNPSYIIQLCKQSISKALDIANNFTRQLIKTIIKIDKDFPIHILLKSTIS